MPSETLMKAARYEEAEEKKLEKSNRPLFHLTPRIGWMNDPNGFSYYNDRYHLFYQYHPYNTYWGPMHWGHAVSKDLLHWEYLPVAMAPDSEYDNAGCFSGSAVTQNDGRHLLMYTGVSKEKAADGREYDIQTQCVAVGDGETYEKYKGNPVIDARLLPENASISDFRDPHIYIENGIYKAVCVNRAEDGFGSVLLFNSKDGFNWEFERTVAHNDAGKLGIMWECPDYFSLDNKRVLFISTQSMKAKGTEFCAGYGNICMIGHLDEKENFICENVQTIDYGYDFYGHQTVLAPDNRRIMIGWMQNWDNVNYRRENCLWYGQMSIPREIRIVNNRLYQNPIREIDALRKDKVEYKEVVLDGERSFEGVEGRIIDLELNIHAKDDCEMYKDFSVKFAKDEEHFVSLRYKPSENAVELDRSLAGSREGIVHFKKCSVSDNGGNLKLRILLDMYSAEIFINDGEEAMTFTFYTDISAQSISFASHGALKLDVEKYNLMEE